MRWGSSRGRFFSLLVFLFEIGFADFTVRVLPLVYLVKLCVEEGFPKFESGEVVGVVTVNIS